jgi:hypothetical protein
MKKECCKGKKGSKWKIGWMNQKKTLLPSHIHSVTIPYKLVDC